MPDLVIGSRRGGVQRPWRAGGIAIALVGVAIVVAWFIYRRSIAYDVPPGEIHGELALAQTAPGAPPLLTYGASSLAWAGGIPVLRVTGDAHAIGAAHGRLLARQIAAVARAAAPSIAATVSDDGLLGGLTHNMRLAWRWRFIDDGLLEQDRRMVAGMARGAQASGEDVRYDELLRDQAVLDVGAPSPRSGEVEQHTLAHSLTVVATQAQAPGRVWIGRTFALPGYDDGGEAERPVLVIAHPDGRIAWAGVGWPGELGVVTGINAQGIALMVDPAHTADVRPTRTARPVALLARSVLEQAKTLDEAIKLLETSPTLGAASILVCDGTTGTWVVVERTPSKAIVERNPKLPAIGDVLTTNALASDPENDRARRLIPTLGRVERAAKLVKTPLPDLAAMAQVLRDGKTTDDTARPLGHRGVIDDARAAHTIILDPAALQLWIADPTAGGRMRAFDLRHELRGEGEQASPPADIPADPSADPDRLADVIAARAELRVARGAWVHGEPALAAEAVSRARARAPSLPEAIELAAIIAHERGDDAAARAAYQLWLDGGADDPPGEERARALLTR